MYFQFIELNQLKDCSESVERIKVRIAQQALHRVPRQLTSYMRRNNISAKPPIQTTRSNQPSTTVRYQPPEPTKGATPQRAKTLRHKAAHLMVKNEGNALRPPSLGRLVRPKSECDEDDDDIDSRLENTEAFAFMREVRSGSVSDKTQREHMKKQQVRREIQYQYVCVRQPILHLPPEGRGCHSAIGRLPSDPSSG